MKKLEIIIRPERLDDLKTILNSCNAPVSYTHLTLPTIA